MISLYPFKGQKNCCIIIFVSINFFCKIHSIFISFPSSLVLTLGKVQMAFSPVINKTSNSIFFFKSKLGGNGGNKPFMINLPVLAESVVSIDVALNTGISTCASSVAFV